MELTKLSERINLEEEVNQQVTDLMLKVKPEWKGKDINCESLSGGFINKLVCCSLKEDPHKTDAYVVRIYGSITESVDGVDRDQEVMGMQLACIAGCGLPVLAMFNNGFIYKYSSGNVVQRDQLFDNGTFRLVAKSLAQMHTVNLEKARLYDRTGNQSSLKPELTTFNMMKKGLSIYKQAMSGFPDTAKKVTEMTSTLDTLEAEATLMETILSNLNLPKCFVHHDFHIKNLVISKERDMFVLDYEFCGIGVEMFDLASIILDRDIMIFSGLCNDDSPKVDEKIATEWIKMYYQEVANITGNKTDLTSKDLRAKYLEHRIAGMVTYLFWILLCLPVTLVGYDALDIMRYIQIQWSNYVKDKVHLDAWTEELKMIRESV